MKKRSCLIKKIKQPLIRSRELVQKESAAFQLLRASSLGRLDFDSGSSGQIASILTGHGHLVAVNSINSTFDLGGKTNGGNAKQEGQGQGGNDSFFDHLSTPFLMEPF
jgi:uncharacterized sporulation protein YeaH/YhbH (DUF444 family)